MKELTFDLICENLKNGINFSWSRWGDGEWSAVLQTRPGKANCDGHQFFPDMGARLKDILESKPEYYLGLQRLGAEQNADNPEFQRLRDLNTWTEMELLTRASLRGRLFEMDTSKTLVMVGNNHLAQLGFFDLFIGIPLVNCWQKYEETKAHLFEMVAAGDVVYYCASMMSNVLIDDMYKKHRNTITQIDCGSVFDPYSGRNTRTYHSKVKV